MPETNSQNINDGQYLSPSQIAQLTGIDAMSFLNSTIQANRQRVFNGKQSINDIKIPNAGKPLNNNDPYPVDKKIQELETHQPRIKKYSVEWHHEPAIAQALLDIGDYAEKRIVRLENLLATVMRYVFAIGGRMFVNCLYFGGTDSRSKYTCIRCLRDDRIADGQVVQLDQCLACTRYEEIIGRSYDVLNETGTNLSIINDDCQMSYMNMRDYVEMCQVDQMHKPRERSMLSTDNLNQRNAQDKDFAWGQGIKINWKQDINSPGSSTGPLASARSVNGYGGSGNDPGFTTQPGQANNTMSSGTNAIQEQLKKNEEKKQNANDGGGS